MPQPKPHIKPNWRDGAPQSSKSTHSLDFQVSSRGWCYVLEPHGLDKGDFGIAEKLITECRKNGSLPLNICAVDESRGAENVESIDDTTPQEEAEGAIGRLRRAHLLYRPVSFWDGQDYFLQMGVEKIDLKSLFGPICEEFSIPICNFKGWSDLNSRADMMRRFAYWEERGKRPVLLYCGDHDPAGLLISSKLQKNFADLAGAVGWSPDNLVIDRFGLNADFIKRHRLTWIEGLKTSSGEDLADPEHHVHYQEYVQAYLKQFGARKVEANALVVRPEAGRELCRQAILKYVPESAIEEYEERLKREQGKVQRAITKLIAAGGRRS